MFARDDPMGKAPRRARWRWAMLLGTMILAGIVLLVIYVVVIRPPATAEQYSPPRPPVQLSAAYYEVVKGHIAQGLGLSVTRVKAEIEADPSEGLFGVATAQSVSPDQLYTIELDALQAASDQMVAIGGWTQQQHDATMQYWRQRGDKALGSDMTDCFLHR